MRKVLVFGTFDLLHKGHLNFFQQALSLGEHLTVVVATDANAQKAKGAPPTHSQEERLAQILQTGLVQKVILGDPDYDYLKTISEEQPDIIALGYDQQPSDADLASELAKAGLEWIEVTRLRPYQPHRFKSSLLKNKNR